MLIGEPFGIPQSGNLNALHVKIGDCDVVLIITNNVYCCCTIAVFTIKMMSIVTNLLASHS